MTFHFNYHSLATGDNYLVLGHKYQWLAGGYDLNIGLFLSG